MIIVERHPRHQSWLLCAIQRPKKAPEISRFSTGQATLSSRASVVAVSLSLQLNFPHFTKIEVLRQLLHPASSYYKFAFAFQQVIRYLKIKRIHKIEKGKKKKQAQNPAMEQYK